MPPKTRNPRISQSQPSQSSDSTKKGKKDASSKVDQSLCVTCNIDVGEESSLPCDFCSKYTHLKCEELMNNELCDALNKHQPNPLLYLCTECRPMLIPEQSKNIWAGFLERVIKAVSTATEREPLADKIMNKMSTKIEHLDDMIREHRTAVRDMRNDIEIVASRHSDSLAENSAALNETKEALNEVCSQFMAKTNSIPTQCQRPYPHPQPAPRQSRTTYSHIVSTHTPNYQSDINQPRMYSGPPMQARKEPRPPPPEPENTLVVYNTEKDFHTKDIVEDLMLRCNIYQYEVLNADKMSKSSDNRSYKPIFIRCDTSRTKWSFMRQINELRRTNPDYRLIYARPYLDGEALRADRNLYRKLVDIRNRHSDRIFKIYRGDIYEKTDENFKKYTEPIHDNEGDDEDSGSHCSTGVPVKTPETLGNNHLPTDQPINTQNDA